MVAQGEMRLSFNIASCAVIRNIVRGKPDQKQKNLLYSLEEDCPQ